jgi:hypothetical protein
MYNAYDRQRQQVKREGKCNYGGKKLSVREELPGQTVM